jgi:hypothetical protein
MPKYVPHACQMLFPAQAVILLAGLFPMAALAEVPALQVARPKPVMTVEARPEPSRRESDEKTVVHKKPKKLSPSKNMQSASYPALRPSRPIPATQMPATQMPATQMMVSAPPSSEPRPPAPPPAPPPFLVDVSPDGTAIFVYGGIEYGLTAKFRKMLEQNPTVKTVVLNSRGGLVVEGAAVAKIVRDRGLNTHVDDYCESSCTPILIAGKSRTISAHAIVGFHRAHNTNGLGWQQTKTNSAFGDAVFKLSYSDSKIDPKFIAKALATPHATMWHPPAEELRAALVITAPAQDRFFQSPVSFKLIRADVMSDLLKIPFWQKAMQADPARTTRAIGFAWTTALVRHAATVEWTTGIWYILDSFEQRMAEMPDDVISEYASLLSDNASRLRDYCFNRTYAYHVPTQVARSDDFVIQLMSAKPTVKRMSDDDALLVAVRYVIAEQASSDMLYPSSVPAQICASPITQMKQISSLPPAESARAMRAMIVASQLRASKIATGDF